MNNSQVKATGLDVQATAEGGIQIAPVTVTSSSGSTVKTAGTYSSTADAGYTSDTAVSLLPTSTANVTDWWHATAIATTAKTADTSTYVKVSEQPGYTSTIDGIGKVTTNQDETTVDANYYLAKTFHIRSSSAAKEATNLAIDSVKVTGYQQALSKSLRVAVVVDDSTPIFYAPNGGDSSNGIWNGTNLTTLTTSNNTGSSKVPTSHTGTITYADGVYVTVYVYFEGEDTEHYSDHLVDPSTGTGYSLDKLDVTLEFSATVS